ncbi:hypothetical protein GCM10010109_86400 [Actinoplanes campanulatus]|nr:hypothetical protein GCM10010109_86400 [Actinoplanes campanulatus]GID41766.1 hypothetical protein Aca09nite_82720 [Actinoplanes campanulatus]
MRDGAFDGGAQAIQRPVAALTDLGQRTFREDQHQARTGNGPAIIATLGNTAISWHRSTGATNIARATRQANRRSHDLITAVTSSYPTTQ